MRKIINSTGEIFIQLEYTLEKDFEKVIIDNAETIFGKDGIYFDLKKLIGKPKKGAAIPDGYYLDLTFHNAPRLYLVEVELARHDVYGHIGEQILRFGISTETPPVIISIRNRNDNVQNITEGVPSPFCRHKSQNPHDPLLSDTVHARRDALPPAPDPGYRLYLHTG